MLSPTLKQCIEQQLEEERKGPCSITQIKPISGGSINQTYKLTLQDHQAYFCKINSASAFPQLFEKEANGLYLLKSVDKIKVPEVILQFESKEYQVLLLEWVESGTRTEAFWKSFGEELAALHGISNSFFGLQESNYMGSVHQKNTPHHDWNFFFINLRLIPLVNTCVRKNLLNVNHANQFELLYKKIKDAFPEHQSPALLHGDLWSGNFMCSAQNSPVLIDPAVYFGHPCVDLAMTTLFGGFNTSFYEAYQYYAPFPANYKEQ